MPNHKVVSIKMWLNGELSCFSKHNLVDHRMYHKCILRLGSLWHGLKSNVVARIISLELTSLHLIIHISSFNQFMIWLWDYSWVSSVIHLPHTWYGWITLIIPFHLLELPISISKLATRKYIIFINKCKLSLNIIKN